MNFQSCKGLFETLLLSVAESGRVEVTPIRSDSKVIGLEIRKRVLRIYVSLRIK
jgi:hypothetical protein